MLEHVRLRYWGHTSQDQQSHLSKARGLIRVCQPSHSVSATIREPPHMWLVCSLYYIYIYTYNTTIQQHHKGRAWCLKERHHAQRAAK